MAGTDHGDGFADRLSELTRQLAVQDSPLALGLWERGTAPRIGRVTSAIKGYGDSMRRIEDGYQYVGGFPAHMWRAATTDESYKTLSYGIKTFWKRWGQIVEQADPPTHYVSIGPGTGDKDGTILRYLQKRTPRPVVYIPVDLSADLLRMSLDSSLEGVDEDRVDVLPVELDITSDRGLDGLRQVIDVMTDGPVLISVLGNTIGNFREDVGMLERISSLLSSADDMLLLELATTEEASRSLAERAGNEYGGSVSFRNFVMAALGQYTNVTPESGEVRHQGNPVGDILEVITYFAASEELDVYVNDTDHFVLPPDETIELYRSRKYTEAALERLTQAFDVTAKDHTAYSDDFGIVTCLMRAEDFDESGQNYESGGQ